MGTISPATNGKRLEAVKTETNGVEVRAAIDEAQVVALHGLWALWAAEEEHDFSSLAWAGYLQRMIATGHYMPLVALDDSKPVGMVECLVDVDPMDGKVVGFADHAYVAPEWRNLGVFAKLAIFANNIGKMIGVERTVIPVSVKSEFLRDFYREFGFEVSGYLMRRDEDGDA